MVRKMLQCLGEDPDCEGLQNTPERFASAMLFLTKGYSENLTDVLNGAIFTESSQLVLAKDIELSSLCEHHLLPFQGKVRRTQSACQVSYLPFPADPHRLYPERSGTWSL